MFFVKNAVEMLQKRSGRIAHGLAIDSDRCEQRYIQTVEYHWNADETAERRAQHTHAGRPASTQWLPVHQSNGQQRRRKIDDPGDECVDEDVAAQRPNVHRQREVHETVRKPEMLALILENRHTN